MGLIRKLLFRFLIYIIRRERVNITREHAAQIKRGGFLQGGEPALTGKLSPYIEIEHQLIILMDNLHLQKDPYELKPWHEQGTTISLDSSST